jgi:hypothetical protein
MGMGSLKDHWMEQRSDEDIRVVDWRNHELVLARLNYMSRTQIGFMAVLTLGLLGMGRVRMTGSIM